MEHLEAELQHVQASVDNYNVRCGSDVLSTWAETKTLPVIFFVCLKVDTDNSPCIVVFSTFKGHNHHSTCAQLHVIITISH